MAQDGNVDQLKRPECHWLWKLCEKKDHFPYSENLFRGGWVLRGCLVYGTQKDRTVDSFNAEAKTEEMEYTVLKLYHIP